MEIPLSRTLTDGPASLNSACVTYSGMTLAIDSRYKITSVFYSRTADINAVAVDSRTGSSVHIRRCLGDSDDVEKALSVLRRMRVLRLLRHENILEIDTVQLPLSRHAMNEIYIVHTDMETDLARVIRSHQALSTQHHQYFMYQLFRGLKFLHSGNVVHGGLKSWCLLVNSDCSLKISGFGSARVVLANRNFNRRDSWEAVTRPFNAAPELYFTSVAITPAIDIWAAGCILGELLLQRPIFDGLSTRNGFDDILSTVGPLNEDDLSSIPRSRMESYIRSFVPQVQTSIEAKFAGSNPLSIDLLKKVLQFNPAMRPTAAEALQHPYFAEFHDEADEPVATPLSFFNFMFERESMDLEEIKDLIYEEILMYHFPQKVEEYEGRKREAERSGFLPVSEGFLRSSMKSV